MTDTDNIHDMVARAIRASFPRAVPIDSPEFAERIKRYGKRTYRRNKVKEGTKGETQKKERAG